MKPPSQRKYAFNAMFSKSTNKGRKYIANVLEENSGNTMSTYVKLKDRWSGKEHGPNFTDQYMNVLVESAFTISPDGANPECFRMYEAIEAGFIPVMQKGRASGPHGQAHRCRLAMKYWYSSPVVLLDSWDDLYPTIHS